MKEENKLEELREELAEKSNEISNMFNELSKKYKGVTFDFELETVEPIMGDKSYSFKITARL